MPIPTHDRKSAPDPLTPEQVTDLAVIKAQADRDKDYFPESSPPRVARYLSVKTYGHEVGLSCCFRQWRADSHCKYLHGYALKVKVEFAAERLDERNWVVDFGSMKSFKGVLEGNFDHRLLVAEDDPELGRFRRLEQEGLAQLVVLPRVGCEAFAEYIAGFAEVWLHDNGYAPRVWVYSVEVSEHGGNSAVFYPKG